MRLNPILAPKKLLSLLMAYLVTGASAMAVAVGTTMLLLVVPLSLPDMIFADAPGRQAASMHAVGAITLWVISYAMWRNPFRLRGRRDVVLGVAAWSLLFVAGGVLANSPLASSLSGGRIVQPINYLEVH